MVEVPFGLPAQPHPFVVTGLVQQADFDVADGLAHEMVLDRLAGRRGIVGMHQPLEARLRVVELSVAESQELLEARAEPEFVGLEVDLPHAVAGAAHGAGETLLGRRQGGFGALQVGDVGERARDTQDLPTGAVSHVGLLRDPAFRAVRQAQPVLASVGGRIGSGFERCPADAFDVVGMYAKKAPVHVVELSRARDAKECV